VRRWWLAVALGFLIVPNLQHLRPGAVQDIDPTFWTAHELALAGFDTTTLGELTPRWMRSVPPYNPRATAIMLGDAEVKEWRRTPFYWSGEVRAQQPAVMQMSYAYFPGWRVQMDGSPAAFGPSEPHGLIEFPVPPGAHRVEVQWGRSPARLAGDGITLVSLAVMLVVGLFARRRTLRSLDRLSVSARPA
jgi:hypothetical protein